MPRKPELVTWRGAEWQLHQAALHRGHAEALGDVAGNLKRASDQYRAQVEAAPDDADWREIALGLTDAFRTMGDQFGQQAAKSSGQASVYLGQACQSKAAATGHRPGWWARLRSWAVRRRIPVLGWGDA